MKIFDVNTAIGHWPFRKLPTTGLETLKLQLEAAGISGALVANINGIFYKNCHDANLELAAWIGAGNAYFYGIATINPVYAQWEKDLRQCVKEFDFRALRLLPLYHGYELNSRAADAILEVAAELDIPVFIPQRIVDIRQRHWLDVEKTVGLTEICSLACKHPAVKIVFTECQLGELNAVRDCGNLYIEISRLRSAYGRQISKTAAAIGYDKLLFGSGAPFKEISSSLLKLEHAKLKEIERDAVAGTNACKLLKIQ
ncbi:MAG: amidohydrolase family protein [Victivallales bacterium]|nr:amidohydrolase family protein [Victivallales bacterium]